ncbi:MAG: TIGR00725 family protein [Anaerolineae bacterium]
MEKKGKTLIAVIGASRCSPETARLAQEVGRRLAEKGAVLVCGGLGGVMEAACRGAKEAGGMTIGILPGTNHHEANPYVDIPIVTGMGEARNVIVVRTAQAVIAVAGEYGTLSEIAFALKMGRPVVGLQTWELAQNGRPVEDIIEAATPMEAVEKALALAL